MFKSFVITFFSILVIAAGAHYQSIQWKNSVIDAGFGQYNNKLQFEFKSKDQVFKEFVIESILKNSKSEEPTVEITPDPKS